MLPSTGRRLVATCLVVVGLSLLAAGAVGLAAATAGEAAFTSTDETATTPPEPVSGLDLPERVDLAGTPTGGSAAVGLDVGAGIHGDGVEVDAAYDRELLAHRFDEAATDEERRAVLAEAVARANETTRSLREQERRARADYRAGNTDEREFVSQLRAINDLAEARLTVLDAAMGEGRDFDDSLHHESQVHRAGFLARQGQIRAILSESMAGDRPARDVYVATTGDGTVLATTTGGTFHRETNRDDLFTDSRSPGIGWDAMRELFESELYPRFLANNTWNTLSESFSGGTIYYASSTHDHGRLDVYLDTNSEDIFREYHQLDLGDSFPTRTPVNATTGTLELQVGTTYPSGPSRVVVTDAGQPVADAPIALDGTEVARTGEDGVAWIVQPHERTTVRTSVDRTSVRLDVTWPDEGGGAAPEKVADGERD